MAKSVCLLLYIILVTALLFGCSKQDSTQETIHPHIVELIDSLPVSDVETLPNQIIAETDQYLFTRKDGVCYLSFKSGNQQIKECPDKECPLSHSISFDSMEDLYQWLKAPEFDEKKETAIRHTFGLDENNGFILPDPYRLYTIETPKGYTVTRVGLLPSGHKILYKNNNHINLQNVCNFSLEFFHESVFPGALSQLYCHEVNTCNNPHQHKAYQLGDTTYVEWTNDDNSRSRTANYILESEAKTIFASEYCRIYSPENPSVTPESPDHKETYYLTYSNGAYYSLWVNCPTSCYYRQNEDVMQLNFIKQFDIFPYMSTSPKH